jgi:hypothetical protein
MQFGVAVKDKPFGDSYNATGADYLRTLKEGQSLVRFVFPLDGDNWIGYYEHFNPANKRSVPCLRDADGDTSRCGACNSGSKDFSYAGRKVATNIQLVDKGVVLPIKMSQRLFEAIERRAERDGGDVTKRDYLITRSGKGTDTTYDVDREDAYDADLKALRKESSDVREILKGQYEEYWSKYGEDEAPKTKKVAAKVDPELDVPDF